MSPIHPLRRLNLPMILSCWALIPDLLEKVAPHLDQFGILAIMANTPMPRKVNVDVGRVHYHRWVYVGSAGNDIAAAYHDFPVRSTLRPGGRAWFVGAGGPMGRMHVQRAIEFANPPATIVCTDVSDMRLGELCDSFAQQARDKGIEFICINPTNKAEAWRSQNGRPQAESVSMILSFWPRCPRSSRNPPNTWRPRV